MIHILGRKKRNQEDLFYEEIKNYPERVSNIKPFIDL